VLGSTKDEMLSDPLRNEYMSDSSFWDMADEIETEFGNAEEEMSPEAKAGLAGVLVAAKREMLQRLTGWASDDRVALRDLLQGLFIRYVEYDGELVKYGNES